MNQSKKQLLKSPISQRQRKGLNTAMMKSEASEVKSQNSDHIHIPNLHTQPTNMSNTQHMTTNTNGYQAKTEHIPQSRLEAMNPSGTNLPPPSIPTLGKSEDDFLAVPGKVEKKPVTKAAVSSSLPANRIDKLVADYTKLYATIGLFVTRADPYDGILLIKESENRAVELINVAKHHKGMMKTLERLAESNDYITLAIGHGMMLYAIMAHHGRVKADPLFLAQLGYHEQQVLQVPDGTQGMNGSTGGAQQQSGQLVF